MVKRRLLIIDDEEGLRSSLKTFLSIKGYEAVAVGSGEEGIKQIEEFKPGLLLLDLHLSEGLTGVDVLRKVKFIDPDLKVVILTGFGDEDDVADECHGLGALKLLSKPLSANEIKKALDAIP